MGSFATTLLATGCRTRLDVHSAARLQTSYLPMRKTAASETEVSRRFKLRSGPPEPHHHADPPLASARQPAAARPASRAFCPDLLPQHAPRPRHDTLLAA